MTTAASTSEIDRLQAELAAAEAAAAAARPVSTGTLDDTTPAPSSSTTSGPALSLRPELALFVLALVALVGCVLLLALGDQVPEFLQTAVIATVVGGAGVATPRPANGS